MIDPTTNRIMSERSYHGATSRSSSENIFNEKKKIGEIDRCILHGDYGLMYYDLNMAERIAFVFYTVG